MLRAVVGCGLLSVALATAAAELNVGPGQPFATPCAAIAAANDGDTIRIDAAGSYDGNVCAWNKNGLTLVGVNGRARIDAAGQHSQGKAIWVIVGNDTLIENIELSGCVVPDDNGAGIRQEGRNLTVRNVIFRNNQNGILANSVVGSTITVEFSEFADNGAGDGQSHNLYVNAVDRLVFRYNWSHGARVGHLLKSRARENHILYNRLTGETGGTESYEINLPNGGLSFVVGNLIEQPPTSQNGAMLDYLSEGGAHPDSRVFVINNSFVNNRGAGTFMQIAAATPFPIVARNNIFFGGGTVTNQAGAVLSNNLVATNPLFVAPAQYDYRLQPGSPAINAGVDPGSVGGQSLNPEFVYLHPALRATRVNAGTIDIGAYELSDTMLVNGFE